MSDIDADEAYLDGLERRARRRALQGSRPTPKAPKPDRPGRAKRGPVLGPPAPRKPRPKGLKNAARSEADKDQECEDILAILQRMAAGLTNNGGTK